MQGTATTRRRLPLVLGLAAALALSACDNDRTGRGRNAVPPINNRLTGQVQAGPVEGATVVAFRINADGSKGGSVGQTATGGTDSNGTYFLAFNDGSQDYTGPLLLEATGGTYTDEATGNTVTLSATLRAVVIYNGGSQQSNSTETANVTPLTSLAAALAERASGGFSGANVMAANAAINGAFGGTFDVTTTTLADPAKTQAVSDPATADYVATVAGVSFAASSQGIAPNTYFDNLAADAADGKLDGRGRNGQVIFNDGAVALAIARGVAAFQASANNAAGVTISQGLNTALAAFDGNLARDTVPGVDPFAPQVTENFPKGGSMSLPTNTRVFVRFDEELDPNTVNSSTFAVLLNNVAINGSVSYNAASRVAVFTPAMNLNPMTTYSVAVRTGIQDLQGNALASSRNFNFTTGAMSDDNSGFSGQTSISFSPSAQASTVNPNSSFVVTLGGNVPAGIAFDPTSLAMSGVVTLSAGGQAVPFKVDGSLGGRSVIITPVFSLPSSSTVTLTLTGSALSTTGGQLGADRTVTVTTENAGVADQVAPTVVAVEPTDMAVNAQTGDRVQITFSEAMNPATVLSAVSLSLNSNPVNAEVTYSATSNSATLRPTAALSAGATYTVSVGTGAQDVAGNGLAQAFSSTFTVGAQALTIVTNALPNAIVGQPYSQGIVTAGGTAPLTFTLQSGSQLPAGLMLNSPSNGVISGTPQTAGATTFTIVVTDSSPTPQTATQQLTLTVDAQAAVPTVSFAQTQSMTANEASQSFAVNVVLNTPSPLAQDVTATVTDTLGGTAQSGVDYQALNAPVVRFPAGSQNGLTVSITIGIINDNLFEGAETIVLSLGNVQGGNATLGGAASHTVTITDDGPFPSVALDAGNVLMVNEGGVGTVAIALSNPTVNTVTVPFTVTGAAMNQGPNADHDLMDGQLVVQPGTTSASVSFNALTDMLDEDDMESLVVTLGNPVNGNANLVNPSTQTFAIVDQNGPSVVSINDLGSLSEGAGSADFTVSISPPHGRSSPVSVDFMVVAGSATEGADYTNIGPGTVMFAAGDTQMTISVPLTDDTIDEDDESLSVQLTSPQDLDISMSDGTGDVTITDNDNPPSVSFTTATQMVSEGVGMVELRVALDNTDGSGKTISVPFMVDGSSTALNPADHDLMSGAFMDIPATTMPPGVSETAVTFMVNDDNLSEVTETIIVNLGTPTNATLGNTPSQTISIMDNEGDPALSLDILNGQGGVIAPTGGVVTVDESVGALSLRASLAFASSRDVTFDVNVGMSGTTSQPREFTDITSPTTPVRLYVARNGSVSPATVAAFTPFTGTPFRTETQINELGVANNEGVHVTTTGDLVQAGDVSVGGTIQPSIRIFKNVSDRGEGAAFDPLVDRIIRGPSTQLVRPKGIDVDTQRGLIFVADNGAAAILVFSLAASDDTAPLANIPVGGVTGVSGSVWDVDYDNDSDRLFVAGTDGNVLVYDNFVSGGFPATPARTFAPAFDNGGLAKDSVNLHGIVYVGGSVDRLLLSDVGSAGSTTDGKLFIVDSASTAGAAPAASPNLVEVSLRIDTNTGSGRLGNPVDIVFDGQNLYVAEKTSEGADPNKVLIYADFLTLTNTGAIDPTASIIFPAGTGPESLALDTGLRRDHSLLSQSVTIMAGDTTATLPFRIDNDTRDEANETIALSVANVVNAMGSPSTTVQIQDNDAESVISIRSMPVDEGNEAIFEITLDGASGRTIMDSLSTMDGSGPMGAVSPDDFTAIMSQAVTLAEGATYLQVRTATVDDMLNEMPESFTGNLGANPVNAVPGTSSATVTINDNDNAPVISISGPQTVMETNSTQMVSYDVTLSIPSGQDVTVDVRLTALSPTFTSGDATFTPNPTSLTFSPGGSLTQTVTVTLNGDTVNEANEDFQMSLENIGAAIPGTTSVTTTVNDDDNLSVMSLVATDGAEGGSALSFAVNLNTTSEQTLMLSIALTGEGMDGVEPMDFVNAPTSLTFQPGSQSETIMVMVNDDMVNEAHEGVRVTLAETSMIRGFQGGALTQTATVLDNDDLSVAMITPTNGDENAAGASTPVTFGVSLNTTSEQTLVLAVALSPTGADGFEQADIMGAPTMLTFQPGSQSELISIGVVDDMVNEADEGIQLDLTQSSNIRGFQGGVLSSSAQILDDDLLSVMSITSTDGAENNSGTPTNAMFTVNLNRMSEQLVTFTISAMGGMAPAATSQTDFDLPANTTLTFAPLSTQQVFSIIAVEDAINEANENFVASIALSSSTNNFDAGSSQLSQPAQILDDDALQLNIAVDATTNPALEGTSANQVFNVTIDVPTEQTFTIGYTSMPGMPGANEGVGNDYQLPSMRTVTFAGTPGMARNLDPETITVTVLNDMVNEANESYAVSLDGQTLAGQVRGVSVGMGSATATINDDDELTVALSVTAQGVEGGANVTFQAMLNRASEQMVVFDVASMGGSVQMANDPAEAGDFSLNGLTTLTFMPGSPTTQSFDVLVTDDMVNEANEEFTVAIALNGMVRGFNPTASTLSAVGTIADNDDATISVMAGNPVMEGNMMADAATATFTVTLSRASEQSPVVDFMTAETTTAAMDTGDATADTDFVSLSGMVTFMGASVSEMVTVEIIEDVVAEQNENFQLQISLNTTGGTPRGVTVQTSSATAQITDDDDAAIDLSVNSPITEGGTASYAVNLSGPKSASVDVTFNLDTQASTASDAFDSTDFRGMNSVATAYVTRNTASPDVIGLNPRDIAGGAQVTVTPGNNENVVVGRDGRLYMAGDFQAQPSVRIVENVSDRAGQSFDPLVDTIIRGPSTMLMNPKGLDVDTRRGLIFVCDTSNQTIVVFKTTDSGDASPTAVTSLGVGPWDCDYVPEDDRLFIAMVNGEVFIYDDYVANGYGMSGTPDRRIAPALSGTAVTDNLHGIIYDRVNDKLLLSGVGRPTSEPGQLYVINDVQAMNLGSAGSTVVNYAFRIRTINARGGTVDFANPVDLAYDGVNLYVAEKAGGFVAVFNDFLSLDPGQTGDDVVATPDAFLDVTAPESIALDSGKRADFRFNTLAPVTLTFAPGETSKTVMVPTVNDTRHEGTMAETLVGAISNPTGPSMLGTASATANITDNDTQPAFSLMGVTMNEGDMGMTTFRFVGRLNAASGVVASGTVETVDGTATVADMDYAAINASPFAFIEGQTFTSFLVTVNGDVKSEVDEDFLVRVSGLASATPSGVNIDATGVITDDDNVVTVSVADAAMITEGGSLAFDVSIDAPTGRMVSVQVDITGGSATAGMDFDGSGFPMTVNFMPGGAQTQTVTIPTMDDGVNEDVETVMVTLSMPSNAVLGTATASGMINDNDMVTVSLAGPQAAVTEGDTGTTPMTFTVNVSGPSEQSIVVTYSTTMAGTATSGTDFVAANGMMVTIPPSLGAAGSATFNVSINGDVANEADETVGTMISAATGTGVVVNMTNGANTATGTIDDDDEVTVAFAADPAPVIEGANGDGVTIDFMVTVSGKAGTTIGQDFMVAVSSIDGTAVAGTNPGNDYIAVPAQSTVSFSQATPAATTQTFSVSVNGDAVNEATQSFSLSLGAITGSINGVDPGAKTTATGTILDDDMITVGFAAGTVFDLAEESGTTPFTIQRSGATEQTFSFDFAFVTGNGNARSAAPNRDFAPNSGTLLLTPMVGTVDATVMVETDMLFEVNETFEVQLSNLDAAGMMPSGVSFAGGMASLTQTITIVDNDNAPMLSVSAPATVAEDAVSFMATVTLSAPSGQPVTFDFATNDGTAIAGNDYTDADAMGNTLALQGDGVSATTATFTVMVTNDMTNEADETLQVAISNVMGAVTGTAMQDVTITDNDALVISINSPTANEGMGPMNFVVSTNRATEQTVMVDFATMDDTALNVGVGVGDYEMLTQTVTIDGNNPSVTVPVTINDDMRNEPSESFTAMLSNLSNTGTATSTITIGTATGQATIVDNDPLSITIADASASESAGMVGFTVSFDRESEQAIILTFNVDTSGVMAPANPAEINVPGLPDDFASTSGTLVFQELETSKTINVMLNDDGNNEADETFQVLLTLTGTPDNTTVTDGTANGLIMDDDDITVDLAGAVTVLESAGPANFPVQLTKATGPMIGQVGSTEQTFMVNLATAMSTQMPQANGGANGMFPNDYIVTSGSLTFDNTVANGMAQQTFPVQIVNETPAVNEATEFFDLVLSASMQLPRGVAISTVPARMRQTATITDDDPLVISVAAPAGGGVIEGSNGMNTTANFQITLNGRTDQIINIDYRIDAGGANPGTPNVDFLRVDSTVVFAQNPNVATRTENAPAQVIADRINESNQTFQLSVQNTGNLPANVSLSPGQAVATIFDDDNFTVVLNNANTPTAAEVSETAGNARFEVAFVPEAVPNPAVSTEQTFVINFQTADGQTTPATAGLDYTTTNTNLTINGTAQTPVDLQTPRSVLVPIINDTINEANETFSGMLTNLTPTTRGVMLSGTPADLMKTQTIIENDTVVVTLVKRADVTEGQDALFDLVAVNPGVGTNATGVAQTFTFVFNTAQLTTPEAMGGEDYTEVSLNPGTINPMTPPANLLVNPVLGTVTVPTLEDQGGDVNEAMERFMATLSAVSVPNMTFSLLNGMSQVQTVTITDNDPIMFTIMGNPQTTEADGTNTMETFTITRTGAALTQQTFQIATQGNNGTAMNGTDYIAPNQQLFGFMGSFSSTVAVDATGTRMVTIVADDVNEALMEDYNVSLLLTATGGSSELVTVGGPATQIIVDDDELVLSVTVNPATGEETANGGVRTFTLAFGTGNMAMATDQDISVRFDTVDGTATFMNVASPDDYMGVVNNVTVLDGNPNQLDLSGGTFFAANAVNVMVIDDTINEADEQFSGMISFVGNPMNVSIDVASVNVTITDQNDPVQLAVSGETQSEAGDINFTVANVNAAVTGTEQMFRVLFSTQDDIASGTATPSDFTTITNQSVMFGPSLSQMVLVDVVNDTINEANEAFNGMIAADGANPLPANVMIQTATATSTINDNDDLILRLNTGMVTEADGGPVTLNFSIAPDATSGAVTTTQQSFVVNYSTVTPNGTPAASPMANGASDPQDFTPVMNGMVAVPLNPSNATVNLPVSVLGDNVNELNELVGVQTAGVANGAGAIPGTRGVSILNDATTVDGTIIDDDAINVRITTAQAFPVTESDMAQNFDFSVNLVEAGTTTAAISQTTVTVDVLNDIANLGGVNPFDIGDLMIDNNGGNDSFAAFDPTNTTSVSVTPGNSSQTINLQVVGDAINEPTEATDVRVSNISSTNNGVSIAANPNDRVRVTVDDDDVITLNYANPFDNRLVFERGNANQAGGMDAFAYTWSFTGSADSTEQTFSVLITGTAAGVNGVVANPDDNNATGNRDYTVTGTFVAGTTFQVATFGGVPGNPVLIGALTGGHTLTAVDDGSAVDGAANPEGTNAAGEQFQFTTGVMGTGVTGVLVGDGNTVNGVVFDIPLLNLNGDGATNATSTVNIAITGTNTTALATNAAVTSDINGAMTGLATGDTISVVYSNGTTGTTLTTDNLTVISNATITVVGNSIRDAGNNEIATFTPVSPAADGDSATLTITLTATITEAQASAIVQGISFQQTVATTRTALNFNYAVNAAAFAATSEQPPVNRLLTLNTN